MKALVPPAIKTLHRKMIRSLAQRGVLRTAQRCIAKPWEVLQYYFHDCLPRERRYRSEERAFDRRHNVDTRVQRDLGWMARIASPNWIHGIGYAPVPSGDVARIIAGLNIDYRQFVFVDLGAGKGRAVLVAAQFPFKRIVGVEYSPLLAEAMKTNIASYRNPRQRCFELESLLQDATQYHLPQEPLVLFFHHPFEAVIFRQVRERIEQSLADNPREMLVVYYDPQCKAVFEESAYFRLLQQGPADGRSVVSDDWVVYESLSTATPVERK